MQTKGTNLIAYTNFCDALGDDGLRQLFNLVDRVVYKCINDFTPDQLRRFVSNTIDDGVGSNRPSAHRL